MKKALMVLLVAMFVCTGAAGAGTKVVQVTLGGVNIQVPAPNEFSEVTDISPQTRKRAERLTLPQNRLLAYFIPDADIQRFKKGQAATLVYTRYTMAQTLRGMESANMSSQDFRDMAQRVRQEQNQFPERDRERAQSFVDDVSKDLSKERGVAIDLKVGQPRALGVFADGDNFIAYALLTKMKAAAGGETLEFILASASGFVRVKNKLIFAWVYSKYDSQKDIDWVRAATKDWMQQILSANGAGS
jgi:hypothetical protein